MTDTERYQSMTTDELEDEAECLCERLRIKLDALPPSPENDRLRQKFAEVAEAFDAYRNRKNNEIT